MSKGMLETSTITWGDLVGNGKQLIVPPFQRNYAWEQKDWEDLWSDLLEIRCATGNHYMGSVVLQPQNERQFLLIDGQQRLTTLSILAAVIVHRLKEWAAQSVDALSNTKRAELLENKLLGTTSPTSLRHQSKLKLNHQCDPFYQNELLTNSRSAKLKQLPDPHRLMAQAYDYFAKQISNTPGFETGEQLASFLDDVVALKLLFIQVKVEDEVSAFTVFETLNARGTELTPTDLLKNYLFSKVPANEESFQFLEHHWEQIGSRVGWQKFSDFLRHYLNSVGPLIRGKALFREMRRQYTEANQVRGLLEILNQESEVYQALMEPEQVWDESDPVFETDLRFIREIGIEQAMPALLAGKRHLKPRSFKALVKLLGIALFRFAAVGNRRNNAIEANISKLAVAITNREASKAADFQERLWPIYTSDENFQLEFREWAPQGSKKNLTRLVLAQLQGIAGADVNKHLNIEHLMPKSSGNRAWVNRLGNLLLVESELNRKSGDSWNAKQQEFAKSRYFPQQLLQIPHWDTSHIEQRQEDMAKQAVRLWRFD